MDTSEGEGEGGWRMKNFLPRYRPVCPEENNTRCRRQKLEISASVIQYLFFLSVDITVVANDVIRSHGSQRGQ